MNPWHILGIEPTDDLKVIKRAYSTLLKAHRPEKDPEGYQRVREAFDLAKQLASSASRPGDTARQVTRSRDVDQRADAPPLPLAEPDVVVEDAAIDVDVEAPQTDETAADAGAVDPAAIRELTREIHERVHAAGEPAGFALFLETLERPELATLDGSRLFEEDICGYLAWRYDAYERGQSTWYPKGFARQVFRHYRWHESQHLPADLRESANEIFDVACANSGFAMLQRLAHTMDPQTPEDHHTKRAAKLLLEEKIGFRPRLWRLLATVRQPLFKLLDDIEAREDGSFEFELNTPIVHWWRSQRTRFHFSLWMLVAGLLFSPAPMQVLLESVAESSALADLVSVPFFLASWIFFACVIAILIYALAFCGYRIMEWLWPRILRNELYRLAPGLAISGGTEYAITMQSDVVPVVVALSIVSLVFLYRFGLLLILIAGGVIMVMAEVAMGGGAIQHLPYNVAWYPGLVLLSLFKWRVPDAFDWSEVESAISQRAPWRQLGLITVYLALCGAWGFFGVPVLGVV